MADNQLRVHHFDVARHCDHASSDFGWASRRKLKALWPFALHAQRDLLHVQDDVGHIFADTRQRREFVKDVFDLDRRDRRALKRGEQHATQRIAERQAKATLQWFSDECRLALGITARLLFEGGRLLEFLPVLGIDCHDVPLGVGPPLVSGWAGYSSNSKRLQSG